MIWGLMQVLSNLSGSYSTAYVGAWANLELHRAIGKPLTFSKAIHRGGRSSLGNILVKCSRAAQRLSWPNAAYRQHPTQLVLLGECRIPTFWPVVSLTSCRGFPQAQCGVVARSCKCYSHGVIGKQISWRSRCFASRVVENGWQGGDINHLDWT